LQPFFPLCSAGSCKVPCKVFAATAAHSRCSRHLVRTGGLPHPESSLCDLHGDGKGPAEIAEALGVSRMSVWRALNTGTVLVDTDPEHGARGGVASHGQAAEAAGWQKMKTAAMTSGRT
jgi:hypothetical protein